MTPLFSPDEGSSIAATSSGDSADTVFSDAIFSSGDDFGALPFLDFDMSGQLDALPLDSPPRVTLQNVLLIGRLCLKVTAGYQRYLRWLRDYCSGLAEGNMCGDTVYLTLSGDGAGEPGGGDAGSSSGSGSGSGSPLLLGFQTTSNGFYDVVTQGLKTDADRLARLGGRLAERQRQRHLIGHMACPDQDGRCWKERDCYADPDPSDSAAARTLIPCYRIVDEVRAKIRQFEDALA
ncbi:hypothetical protein ColKHC_13154 [Colletotrichum higginsianum]|nr:hypothetical protein ColKHC_13154 [Colletotrichum higginsianum]